MMLLERWRLLLADESGFTLPELLTSMAIMLTIMSAFTGLLVSTTRAERNMNTRVQAQTEAQLALSKLRREVHCATSAVVATGVAATPWRATLTLDATCPTAGAGTTISWCTVLNGTNRYGLWRYVGAACSGTGVKVADYVSAPPGWTTLVGAPNPPFTDVDQTTTSLAKLGVNLYINVTPTKPETRFRIQDDLVLRNSTRT
jgi:prepilin-type N-terminal cleavage/methylation domain-containing protein